MRGWNRGMPAERWRNRRKVAGRSHSASPSLSTKVWASPTHGVLATRRFFVMSRISHGPRSRWSRWRPTASRAFPTRPCAPCRTHVSPAASRPPGLGRREIGGLGGIDRPGGESSVRGDDEGGSSAGWQGVPQEMAADRTRGGPGFRRQGGRREAAYSRAAAKGERARMLTRSAPSAGPARPGTGAVCAGAGGARSCSCLRAGERMERAPRQARDHKEPAQTRSCGSGAVAALQPANAMAARHWIPESVSLSVSLCVSL